MVCDAAHPGGRKPLVQRVDVVSVLGAVAKSLVIEAGMRRMIGMTTGVHRGRISNTYVGRHRSTTVECRRGRPSTTAWSPVPILWHPRALTTPSPAWERSFRCVSATITVALIVAKVGCRDRVPRGARSVILSHSPGLFFLAPPSVSTSEDRHPQRCDDFIVASLRLHRLQSLHSGT